MNSPKKREPAEAYRCFKCFLELGRNRSLKNAAELAHVHISSIRHYSKHYSWQERAAHYDADIIARMGEQARREYEQSHKATLTKFAVEQQRRAVALGKLADLMIEITTDSIDDMQQSGEVIDRQQLAAVARTAAALADASLQVGAASLGVDDLMEALNPEER